MRHVFESAEVDALVGLVLLVTHVAMILDDFAHVFGWHLLLSRVNKGSFSLAVAEA